jgi:hypothetical protein
MFSAQRSYTLRGLSGVKAIIFALLLSAPVAAAPVTATIDPADFPLVTANGTASIVVDADDHRVVNIAASCLADDVKRVTGREPAIVNALPRGPAVVVGSLDRSRLIRAMVEAGKLDVTELHGQSECFKIQRSGDVLVVAGSDRRGAAFGAFELSRAIGVSPWYWWADVAASARSPKVFADESPRAASFLLRSARIIFSTMAAAAHAGYSTS